MYRIDGREVPLSVWLAELRAMATDEDVAHVKPASELAPTAPGAFLYANCGVPGDGE